MVYNNHGQYTQAGGRSPPNGQRLIEWSTPHSGHHQHSTSSASSSSSSTSSSSSSSSSSCSSSTISQSDTVHLTSGMSNSSSSGRCLYSRCFRLSYIVYMLAACMTIQTVFFLAYHMGLGGSHMYRLGKGREGKGREGKGREGKGREGKGREEISLLIVNI